MDWTEAVPANTSEIDLSASQDYVDVTLRRFRLLC